MCLDMRELLPRATHSSIAEWAIATTKPTVPTTTSLTDTMDSSIFCGGIPALMTPANADHTPNTGLVKKGQASSRRHERRGLLWFHGRLAAAHR